MDAYVATLLASVIAVLGTVATSIYSQRTTFRSRQQEFELGKAQRQEECERARREAELEQRRACYVALNIAIRRHRAAIVDFLHALRQGKIGDDVRDELEDSRRSYIERHAVAPMTAPGNLLAAAGALREHLSAWYGMAKRLESGAAKKGESLEAAFGHGEEFWRYNKRLRSIMRADLGIPEDPDDTDE